MCLAKGGYQWQFVAGDPCACHGTVVTIFAEHMGIEANIFRTPYLAATFLSLKMHGFQPMIFKNFLIGLQETFHFDILMCSAGTVARQGTPTPVCKGSPCGKWWVYRVGAPLPRSTSPWSTLKENIRPQPCEPRGPTEAMVYLYREVVRSVKICVKDAGHVDSLLVNPFCLPELITVTPCDSIVY